MSDLAKKLADAAVQAIATKCPVATGDRAREVAEEAIRQALGSTQERGEAVALLWALVRKDDGKVAFSCESREALERNRNLTEYVLTPLYTHPPADAQRVAELEAELSAERKDHLCSKTQAHARIAALEAQLTESREREGRMREALHKLLSCGRGTSGRLIIERDEERAAWAALAAEKGE